MPNVGVIKAIAMKGNILCSWPYKSLLIKLSRFVFLFNCVLYLTYMGGL